MLSSSAPRVSKFDCKQLHLAECRTYYNRVQECAESATTGEAYCLESLTVTKESQCVSARRSAKTAIVAVA